MVLKMKKIKKNKIYNKHNSFYKFTDKNLISEKDLLLRLKKILDDNNLDKFTSHQIDILSKVKNDLYGNNNIKNKFTLSPNVMKEVQTEVSAVGGPNPMMSIERYAFYERAKDAYAVIQTGERRFYGCFALRKGVVGPEEG